jgi:glycosyltransferase involved in cell wall biosynthesis
MEANMATQANPRVSVIIPAYNTAHLIAACLDSVFGQTFQDFEAMVVNDGSPDTPELEKILQPYIDRIVYIKQPNKRAAGARNTAIAQARGEFLAFLDSDDTWLPNHLESQMKQFDAVPALGLVYSNALLVNGSPRHLEFMQRCPSVGEATFEAIVEERCQIPVSTVVARKAAIVKAGGFDEGLARCDDYDMWLRAAFYGARVGYNRQVQVHLADARPGSLSASRAKMAEGYRLILENADRRLPLTEAQRRVVCERAAEIRARHLLEEGKNDLSAKDFSKARKRFSEANRHFHHLKLSLVIFGLTVAPKTTSRVFTFLAQRHNEAPA